MQSKDVYRHMVQVDTASIEDSHSVGRFMKNDSNNLQHDKSMSLHPPTEMNPSMMMGKEYPDSAFPVQQ